MKQHVPVALLGAIWVVGLAVGASFAQAQESDEPEPLWAYAWSTQPQPGDTYVPQVPPVREVLPGEDPEEITQLRRVEGSSATYSRMEVRDNHNVIDWFPGDHPPMPDIIKHGPASLMAERGRAVARVTCPMARDGQKMRRPRGSRSATRSSS